MINMFTDENNCCGCGACMNICPKQAISMYPDEYGFIYPQIDENSCMNCGLCKNVCGYQSEIIVPQINDTYVAVAEDENILANSASGGIFASLANEVITRDGVVFGCSLELENKKLAPKHIMIDDYKDIIKLQGSKYVQSFIGNTYSQVKKELKTKRLVLFCGTPCQVDGLKHFLQMKEYNNLITVDLICHGVPNAKMFQDYIGVLENKLNGRVIDFKFRDKSNGWGLNAKATYLKDNKKKNKCFSCSKSSYYDLFLKSAIYRENCYSCIYANANRVGDLTIGDFWGVESEHPQYKNKIDSCKGVSCVIVNNSQGSKMLKEMCVNIKLLPSKFEKVARENTQLNHPSPKSEKREIVLDIYKHGGYAAVEKWYRKHQGMKYYVNIVKTLLPNNLK